MYRQTKLEYHHCCRDSAAGVIHDHFLALRIADRGRDLRRESGAEPPADFQEMREAMLSAIETLTYREREIIKLRYGIGDGYTYTLEEVGRVFTLSHEGVRMIEAKAIRKLQHPVRSAALEIFAPVARARLDKELGQ
jgi:RNA polymerase sigma factor (sigma-70 family)